MIGADAALDHRATLLDLLLVHLLDDLAGEPLRHVQPLRDLLGVEHGWLAFFLVHLPS